MADAKLFPLPFESLRTISGKGNKPFIVGAMFTAAYSQKAERLAASCEKFALPYVLHEVPVVHSSISVRGSADLSFTKANFIHRLLQTHKKPVLYMDADCEFISSPDLITDVANSGCDFAIYNWAADTYNDTFKPMKGAPDDTAPAENRFFRNLGGPDLYSTAQLVCSGAVQFYRNSRAARALLSRWHRTIAKFPGCADDHCMDFTHNNLTRRSWLYWFLKTRWLPKAYMRYIFWIYVEPVINHPDYPAPNSHFKPIGHVDGCRRYYPAFMTQKETARIFPRGCIVDTEQHMICKLVDGAILPVERTEQNFWI